MRWAARSVFSCEQGCNCSWQPCLFFMQGLLGSTAAFALSTGCTQVNALSTTSTYSTFPSADFDAGDKLTVSFYNDGLDTSGLEPGSDHVLVESAAYSPYLIFYASDHTTAGNQSVTVPAGSLSASGLNLFVSTANGNISNITYSCTNATAAAPVAGTVSATVAANSSANAISLSITGGTATSVAIATVPSHGTATASGTSITYTPVSGYSGTDSFTYTATNSTGTSVAATVSITVTAPTLVFSPAAGALAAGTVGTAYNQTITITNGLAPYTVTLSASGNATGTTTTNSATVAWTPSAAGTYSITVHATDADGVSGSAAYTIAVADAAPVAGAVSATVAANSSANPISLSLSGGTATSVAVASAPSHGTATASGTSITYTPTSGYSGTDTFTYTATNATGTSAAATVAVTVSAPSLVFAPAAGTLASGAVNTAYSQAVAASGGTAPYTYSATGLPTGLSISSTTGAISGTPTASGNFTPAVTATDANHATGSVSYTLYIAPLTPVASNVSATVAANSSANAITLSLSGGAATSVAVASAASHGTATASGTSIAYTPISGYSGTDSFTYTATNATGTSAAATVTVTVSAPSLAFTPAAGALASGTINTAYTQAVVASGGAAPYTYSATGLPAGLSISSTSGTISGTPTALGSFTPSVTVTDANHATGAVSYTLYIAPLTPVASNVSATVAANSSANPITLSLSGGAATSVAVASAASHGTATPSGTSITYTPTSGYSGTDSFTYTATNATGTSAAATVTVTVSAPSLVFTPAAGALASGTVNTAYSQSVAVSNGTSPYTYSATGLPAGLSISSTTGTISGTPTASGNFTPVVTATDANRTTGSVSYTLYIAPLTPVASNVSATVTANSTNNAITLNVAGGAATTVAIVTAARHGLATVSGTSITYSPGAGYTGTDSFMYSATNASGSSSATVNITVSGNVPVAEDHNATLYAGQTVSVNLTNGATGGPFTGAAIVSAPAASQGIAKISGNGNAYSLGFTAATQASGAVVIHYTLTNSWGTSTAATVTLQVSTRPDPGKDAEVVGLLNAQAQSAEEFASAQIGNFNERLEQLHSERTRHDGLFNVHVGLPQTRAAQQDAQAQANAAQSPSGAVQTAKQANTDEPGTKQPQWLTNSDVAVWTGGFVNFGTSDQDSVSLSHTLVGLSAGADYRFLPAVVAGFGFGYGRDVTDVGDSGTQSKGEAFSAAFYASFHPGPVYLDGLLGYSHLDFDSRRYVTETGAFANGSRAGDQVFGALTSGYELSTRTVLVAPYARMQFSSTTLQHYAESGAGAFDLAYADQRLTTVSGVAGLRGEYLVPASWSVIKLRGRIEYSHALTGSSTARLGYADTDDNSYAVTVLGLSENQLTAGVGVDFVLPFGLTTGLTYQGTFGMSDHSRNHQFMVRVSQRF